MMWQRNDMIGILILFGSLCLFHGATVTANNAVLTNSNCEPEPSIELYRSSNTDGLTWEQSMEFCQNDGKQLLLISDGSIQQRVESLLQGNVTGPDGVWVAGERRQDSEWRRFDGTLFSDTVQSQNEDSHCVHTVFRRQDMILRGDECKEILSRADPFCQKTSENDTCEQFSNSTFHIFEGICYYVSDTNRNGDTWYQAQTFCREQFGADLAYTHVGDSSLQNFISRTVWLGVTRNPWISGDEHLHYYNWDVGHTLENVTNNRRVSLTSSGLWRSSDANSTLRYFICSEDNEIASTASTKMVTNKGTTTASATTFSSTTTTNGNDDGNIQIIAGAAVGGVVVVAIVVAVVIVILRKRKKDKDNRRPAELYENVDISPARDTSDSNAVYANHEAGKQGASNGRVSTINPYSEVGFDASTGASVVNDGAKKGGPSQSNSQKKPTEVPHQEAESGDLYALSTKTVEAKNMSSEVPHQEAPSGDLYAVSTKTVESQNKSNEFLGVL